MGFKAKQNLSSNGYKKKHKKKQPISSILSVHSKLYKKYKRMYDNLMQKYDSPKETTAINSIMGRNIMLTRIPSLENRQLALLDNDKILSLSIGTIKSTDVRFSVMRLVLETSEGREERRQQNIFRNRRDNQPLLQQLYEGIDDGRRQEILRVRERRQIREEWQRTRMANRGNPNNLFLTFERIQNQITTEPTNPPNNLFHPQFTPHLNRTTRPTNDLGEDFLRRPTTFAQFFRNHDTRQNTNIFGPPEERTNLLDQRNQTNPLGILRLVRTARYHEEDTANQITNLARERAVTTVQHLPVIEANHVENNQVTLPVESDIGNSEENAANTLLAIVTQNLP